MNFTYFIAGSTKEDSRVKKWKDEICAFFNTVNPILKKQNISILLKSADTVSNEIKPGGKQTDINEDIDYCDFFYVLVDDTVGGITREEFHRAYNHREETGKPHVFAYFYAIPKDSTVQKEVHSEAEGTQVEKEDVSATVNDFKDEIKELGNYRSDFSDIDTVKLNMLVELERLLAELNRQIHDSLGNTGQDAPLMDIFFRDGKAVLNGEGIETEILDLMKVPLYKNYPGRAELSNRLERLKMQGFTGSDKDYEHIQKEMHSMEQGIKSLCTTVYFMRQQTKKMPHSTLKAIRALEVGNYDSAEALLQKQDGCFVVDYQQRQYQEVLRLYLAHAKGVKYKIEESDCRNNIAYNPGFSDYMKLKESIPHPEEVDKSEYTKSLSALFDETTANSNRERERFSAEARKMKEALDNITKEKDDQINKLNMQFQELQQKYEKTRKILFWYRFIIWGSIIGISFILAISDMQ